MLIDDKLRQSTAQYNGNRKGYMIALRGADRVHRGQGSRERSQRRGGRERKGGREGEREGERGSKREREV